MDTLIKKSVRQPAIDIAKFIAAILVVTIHTNPLTKVSGIANFILIQFFARMAVPFFIVCTGFFTARKIGFNFSGNYDLKAARIIILKSSWKIFKLYLICSLIYLLLTIPEWITNGSFSYKSFIDWGISFFLYGSYYHLWYLIEVCYALLVLALIFPLLKKTVLCGLAVVLWPSEVIVFGYRAMLPESVQNIISLFDKIKMPFEAIVRVLPLLLVGLFIQQQCRKRSFYLIGFLVTAVFYGAELWFASTFNAGKLFTTLPMAFFVFGLIHSFDTVIKLQNTLALAKISTFVYCAHPAVILIINSIADIQNLLLFFFVTVISVLFGYLYYRISFLIKSRKTT